MANTITLADFFSRFDFVRVKADVIFNEEFDDENWRLCPQDEYDSESIFNFWVTNMQFYSCEYYHKNYGLKFVYSDTMGCYVFVNDLCCGMSYEMYKLKPILGIESVGGVD